MNPAARQGLSATCGCTQTGSGTVFIEGVGAVRSGRDRATGIIQGGIDTVTVEGSPIALADDPIEDHGNCTSDPRTANGSCTVLIGLGGPSGRGKPATGGQDAKKDPHQDLIDRLNAIRMKWGPQWKLKAHQERLIRGAEGPHLEMLQAVVGQMEKLSTGKLSANEYMMNVLGIAAGIAERHGSWWVNPRRLFLNLLDASWAAPRIGDFWTEFSRDGLRHHSPSELGMLIESTTRQLIGDKARVGFSSKIFDTESPKSNVHHHWLEFAMVGASEGVLVARIAQDHIDTWEKNPGDVLNGYFGAGVGYMLSIGALMPTDVYRLTQWAYSANTTAPWPSSRPGPLDSLVPGLIDAFNREHPQNPIVQSRGFFR